MLTAMSARAASLPTLLVLPLDMIDTSGETPSRAKEQEDRLKVLAAYLSNALADDQIYSVIDPTPIGAAIAKARIDTIPRRMQWLRTGPRQAASRRSRVGGTG